MVSTRTLIVASEIFPLAKTGGLGDAVAGMAKALNLAGVATTVLLPAYRGVREQLVRVRKVAVLTGLPGGDASLLAGVCPDSGLAVLLLDNAALYGRSGLYADEQGVPYPDNGVRFAALAHAAVRVAAGLPGLRAPDLIHAHDWHAGLVPLLLHAYGLRDVKTVLTVHNLAFQGLFPLESAAQLGLPRKYCTDDGAQSWGKLNFLKAGIRYAQRITTVSNTYAREILTPAFGCGLEGLLRRRAADLLPIANGIDDTLWNPARDRYLGLNRYSPHDLGNKTRCKAVLQGEFGLEQDPAAVLLAMGSRLTEQKMADVAAHALPLALEAHPSLQVAILGRGDPALQQALQSMAQRYPGRCAVRIGYDEASAHRLHAGADALLHGSRFEPFGLTPLYAMRYGTLPIGSRVGGMTDTIKDPGAGSASTSAMRSANGILFDGDCPHVMAGAIARAMRLRAEPALWSAMQRNGMTADFGWDAAVAQYARLFRTLAGPAANERAQAPGLRPASTRTYAGAPAGALPAPAGL